MNEVKVNSIERIERKGFGYKPIEAYGLEDYSEELNEWTKSQGKLKNLIGEILETWSPATNNDVLLYFEFLRMAFPEVVVTDSKDYVIFKFPKSQVRFFNSPESITRCRRSLNSKGIGLPTNEKVFLKRMKRQKAIRQYYKNETK